MEDRLTPPRSESTQAVTVLNLVKKEEDTTTTMTTTTNTTAAATTTMTMTMSSGGLNITTPADTDQQTSQSPARLTQEAFDSNDASLIKPTALPFSSMHLQLQQLQLLHAAALQQNHLQQQLHNCMQNSARKTSFSVDDILDPGKFTGANQQTNQAVAALQLRFNPASAWAAIGAHKGIAFDEESQHSGKIRRLSFRFGSPSPPGAFSGVEVESHAVTHSITRSFVRSLPVPRRCRGRGKGKPTPSLRTHSTLYPL